MNRFSMWFANFMRGRYGMDNLNRFLMIVALVVIVVDLFLRWRILDLVTLAILILVYCRMFSRNVNARYQENQKFLAVSRNFRNKSGNGVGFGKRSSGSGFNGGFSGSGTQDATHKILRCPGCGEKLRVPKGAGNISISCPHCGTKFQKKV
ncbi:MAG: hypothetical protein Q4C25_04515 [Bacillota bacterium]|nr:hypothetical protein [Bacillota bacterium]